MLVVMSESVAMRMRELGMKCTVVELSVRDCDLSGFTRQRKIDTPTNGGLEIARIAFDLFKRTYRWGKPLRGVGVRGASLVPQDCPIQLGFFSGEEKRDRMERIDKAVDTLRQRYGYTAVQRAVVYTDRGLGTINPKDDHTVHPVGFFQCRLRRKFHGTHHRGSRKKYVAVDVRFEPDGHLRPFGHCVRPGSGLYH